MSSVTDVYFYREKIALRLKYFYIDAMTEEMTFSIETDQGILSGKRWRPPNESGGAPIVLLHDSLGCVGTWRDFPIQLADRVGREVIAYDRLGFGNSSPRHELPSRRFIEEETGFILHILDSLSIPNAVLFGYSVGGAMALTAAAHAPDRVIGVVSESAQAFVEEQTLAGIESAREHYGNPAAVERLERWHGGQVNWILQAWLDVWTLPEFADWSLEPILPLVKCPTLIVHGDRDEFGTVAFPRMIAERTEGESTMVILEGCGHIPHREERERVLAEVERYLAKVGAT